MLDERGSVATPLLLMLSMFVVAMFLTVAVVIPAFAAQQAQSVTDEMQQTANFLAAFTRNNVGGSQVGQGYLQSVAISTAGTLLDRPVEGTSLGDSGGAVGNSYVKVVSLDSVQLLAPGDPVPGAGGLVAREQGVALTFTMQVSMLGGLVNESATRTVWAFPGSL